MMSKSWYGLLEHPPGPDGVVPAVAGEVEQHEVDVPDPDHGEVVRDVGGGVAGPGAVGHREERPARRPKRPLRTARHLRRRRRGRWPGNDGTERGRHVIVMAMSTERGR